LGGVIQYQAANDQIPILNAPFWEGIMRTIDMQTWPRRQHFKFYSTFDHPHFGMNVNVDLTAFYPVVKQQGQSFTVAFVYLLSRAANAVPEFRQRIRGEQVVEHEIVHPSITILTDEDLFSFCTLEYVEDFGAFTDNAGEQIAYVKENLSLEDEPGKDDLLFITALPWVSFTSFQHPYHLNPADSVPRFAWGKMLEETGGLKMPLSVHGHHAVMDGIHMARFYDHLQGYLNQPDLYLLKIVG
jgi:chloramphenicol O-acetyltransferase type A